MVYIPPLPALVDDLKAQITEAVETKDPNTLVCIEQEMEKAAISMRA